MGAVNNGVSISEKVWTVIDDPRNKWNGKYQLVAIKNKNPKYFNIKTDDFDNPVAIINVSGLHYSEPYDIEKFVIYSWDEQYENVWGKPRLRALYDFWYLKQLTMKSWGIYLERFGLPHPIFKVPAGTDEATKKDLLTILKQLRVETGFIMPAGVELDKFEANSTSAGTLYKDLCQYVDDQYRESILGQTLTSSGGGGKGSYALSQTHFDILLMYENMLGESLSEDAINRQVIKQLIDVNFGKQQNYPYFKFNSLESNTDSIKQYIDAVTKNVLKPTLEDQNQIRRATGFKEVDLLPEEQPNNNSGTVPVIPAAQTSLTEKYTESVFTGVKRRTLTPYESIVNFTELKDKLDAGVSDITIKANKIIEMQLEDLLKQIETKKIIKDKNVKGIDKLVISNLTDMKQLFADALERSFNDGMRDARKMIVKRKEKSKKFSDVLYFKQMDLRNMKPTKALEYIKGLAYNIAGAEKDKLLSVIKPRLYQAIDNGYDSKHTVDLIMGDLESTYFKTGEVNEDFYTGSRIDAIADTFTNKAYNQGLRSFMEDPILQNYVEAYQYSTILDDDDRVRPNHKAFDGLIFAVTDSIWNSWFDGVGDPSKGCYPPNGWRCRCGIIPVTVDDEYQLDDLPNKNNAYIDTGFTL